MEAATKIELNLKAIEKYLFLKKFTLFLCLLSGIFVCMQNFSIFKSHVEMRARYLTYIEKPGFIDLDLLFSYKFFSVAVILFVIMYVYCLIEAKQFEYSQNDTELKIKEGILNSVNRTIPIANISDMYIYSGLIEKLAGISIIYIHTPGSASARLIGVTDPNDLVERITKLRPSKTI